MSGIYNSFFSDTPPQISFPSDNIYINMTFELAVMNVSMAGNISEILATLVTALPSALAADMRISVQRFLNVSLRHNRNSHKPPKSLAVIIDEVVSAAQLLMNSGMWAASDQLTQQVDQ